MKHVILALLALLIIVPTTTALGISPATHQVINPQDEQLTLTIINDESTTLTLDLSVEQEQGFLELQRQEVTLEPGEQEQIRIRATTPNNALPGTYQTAITIEARAQESAQSGVVTALPAIKHRIQIDVPAQGAHIRTALLLSTTAANTPVTVTIAATNIGTQNIQEIQSTIEIRGPQGELQETLQTQARPVAVKQTRNLQATWNPQTPGAYLITAYTTYDGQEQIVEREVEIGQLDLEVARPNIQNFSFGEVTRIDIPVTSTWNEELRGVSAQLRVYNETGTQVQSFESLTIRIPPRATRNITAFWDTQGLTDGRYEIEAVINFPPKQRTVRFWSAPETQEPGLLSGAPNWLAYAISLLLALIALIAYLRITYINQQDD